MREKGTQGRVIGPGAVGEGFKEDVKSELGSEG